MIRHSVDSNIPLSGFRTLAFAGIGVIASACMSLAQDPTVLVEDSVIKVVEKFESAVVSIARFTPDRHEILKNQDKAFHIEPQQQKEVEVVPNEFGAGCLISTPNDSERLVLTNYHVVRGGPVFPDFGFGGSTKLLINFADRRRCHAAIIAADPRSDLAVLRLNWIDAKIESAGFPSLDWESASPPRKGQFVILLGNPHAIARDGSPSVSWGMVSNLTRQPAPLERSLFPDQEELAKGSMLYRLGAVMQLDARMNLGLSGGPVLNLKGQMVGISTSLAAIEGYEQSVGFAIPIDNLTRRIIRTLLAGQEVEYGMLGILPEEIAGSDFLDLKTGLPQRSAARVKSVSQGSPAALMGIAQDDVIVNVEGEPVRSVSDLMRLVGLHAPDERISIGVWRSGGRLIPVQVKLGKWRVQDGEGIIETNPRYAPWRRLSVDYATARYRYNENSPGVLVLRVQRNSPAEEAQMEPGNFITFVNNIPIKTPAEFYAAVKGATGPVSVRLSELHPGGRQGRDVKILEPQSRE